MDSKYYPDGIPLDEEMQEEQSAYPDIDGPAHSQWQRDQNNQNNQSFDIGNMLASVIDPRLFGEQVPQAHLQSINQYPQPPHEDGHDVEDEKDEAEANGLYPDEYDHQQYPPLPGEGAASDDEDFVLSEDESESEDEEDEPAEDDDDDHSAASRRRRRGGGRFSGRWGARGGKGIKRGPRKPIEPSPEFKLLHSEATSAFIDGDYERAIDLVMQAIQINPEMFAAHSLLSEIFLAQGENDKALAALFNGAHTRPKDPGVWIKVARLILDRAGDNRQSALHDVAYCYSRILEVDSSNHNIRFQRAAIYRELGQNNRAATEYERLLKECPHSVRALRHLAETYIDLDNVQKAVDHYANSIDHYLSLDPEDSEFTWSDLNIYVELFGYLKQPEEGLISLNILARWLLGRVEDIVWDGCDDDDREWDADDSPRRIKTDKFQPGQWPRESYGLGLPLELRIKMGIFRLRMGDKHHSEALHHFEWLNPEDDSEGARVFDYGDLFREVADSLKQAGLLEEALRYYSPIQQTSEHADISFFMAMADCCMKLGKMEDAESCYLLVAEHDASHMESRVLLAKLYESLGMSEQAMKYVSEAVLIGRQENRNKRRRKDTRLEQLAIEFKMAETETLRPLAPRPAPVAALMNALPSAPGRGRPQPGEGTRTEDIQFLYSKLLELHPQLKDGNAAATEDWLDIADALLRDFRNNRIFYPEDRSITFMGYSTGPRPKGARTKSGAMMDEMQEMAGRLQETMGDVSEEPLHGAIPTDYHGIPFDEWLDIFLQYALLVTEQGEAEEAYETLDSAALASVWLHSKPKSRMIHVCWFTCALRARDEETLAHIARWFIKEYQFVTDTYRLFSMLSHLCGDPHRSLFHSSGNMKFMLRQIKAMDFTMPHDTPRPIRHSVWKERATLSTRDEAGEPITAKALDIALLVLYGHMLYSGNSFYPALNYFFRAYALDDQNPAVLLSIALSFIHHSLKRQSDNRHYLIMQGLSFMHEYRLVRERPGTLLVEKQEMEFNSARVWHSLGLAHLAVEGYDRVLQLGEQIQEEAKQKALHKESSAENDSDVAMGDDGQQQETSSPGSQSFVEDFTREAAYALQCIHVLSGDVKTAKALTDKWLVI
ncbi:Tetratricopeptide-like helical [Penicillium paradoxum]|uniref:Tetratricopeptide-like helical n=1 Tax=Penicillium paradoxum TaxID=176176 RepID=UPI002546E3E9|nr:Tetratricopeptide-like helical [Penicillium paradoxum]KAJ5788676.1 Tetratricopeptide-like helical [Penicillium paradoxum]